MKIRVTRHVVSPKVKLFRFDVAVLDTPNALTGTRKMIELSRVFSRASAQREVNGYKRTYKLTSKNVEWRDAE